jgi:hypothetical protein
MPRATPTISRETVQRLIVRVSLLAVLIAPLISLVDIQSTAGWLRRMDVRYLSLMLAVNLLALGVSTHRWFLLARAAGVQAPWLAFFRISWVSWGVAECGPTWVASEWSRYWLLRGRASMVSLAVSQLVDRMSSYVTLFVLAAAAVLGTRTAAWSTVQMALVVALASTSGAVLVTLLLRRFRSSLKSDAAGLGRVRSLLVKPFPHVLSLMTNLLFAGNLMLAAKAIGSPVRGSDVFVMAPLVLFATVSLPSLVSDWGKREAAAVLVLGQIGLRPEESIAVSLVYGAVNMVSALPGLAGLLRSRTRAEAPD